MNISITFPRFPILIFFLVSCLAIFITSINNTAFYLNPNLENIDNNLIAAVVICLPIAVFSLYKFVFPPYVAKFSSNGIELPIHQGFISWDHLISIEQTQMTVGLTEYGGASNTQILNKAIILHFDESIELPIKFIKGSHGRAVSKYNYIFSTKLSRKPIEDIIQELTAYHKHRS